MTATQELATEIEKTRHPPKPHTGTPLTIEPATVTQSAPQPVAISERPAATPATAATTGAVRVDSTPSGAEVFIDSALAGRTPAVVTVSAGTHSVQVVMPGYQDFVMRVEVAAGAERQVMATLAR
jgi:hypothetical protein